MLKIKSRLGKELVLNEERWRHIKEKHPDMAGHLKQIQETLENPNVVVVNRHDENITLYHRYFEDLGAYVVVVVQETKKFILTAYQSYNIKIGSVLWKET